MGRLFVNRVVRLGLGAHAIESFSQHLASLPQLVDLLLLFAEYFTELLGDLFLEGDLCFDADQPLLVLDLNGDLRGPDFSSSR